MRHYPLFRILTVMTIVLASAVSEASREDLVSIRLLIGLALIYGASVFIRDYFYKADTTFFDFDHRGIREPKEDLIIFGTRVEDLAQQSKERRVLIGLVESAGSRYPIYLAWAASVGLAIYLNFRPGGANAIDIIAPIQMLSGIYFAPFVSQLLAPTLLSLLLAIYTLLQVRTISVVVLFVLFLISFVATLAAYRELDSDRANESKQVRPKRMIRAILAVAALFVALYFVVDFILPEQNPFRSQVTRDPIEIPKGKLSTDKLSRDLAEALLKWQEKTAPGQRGDGAPSGRDAPPSDLADKKADGDVRENGDAKDSKLPNFKAPSGGGAEPNLAQGDKEGQATEGTGRPSSKKGPTNPEQSLEGPGPKTKAGTDESEKPGQAKGNGDGAGRGSPDGKGAGDSTSGGDGKGPGDGHTNGDGDTSAEGGEAGGDKPNSAGDKSKKIASPDGKASPETIANTREKKIEEIQHKVKVPMEVAKGILVIIGIVAVFLLIAKFFSSRKEEDPEKEIKRQQLTERQKKRLQTILGQIRARNLDPNQEVVETYNALLTVFELGHHPREEWLPAEDFSIQIAKAVPPVSKDFAGATSRFSRTLYGQKEVGEEDLKNFRENVARILKFFQVS